MPIRALNIHEPNHELRHSVFFIEQICLIVTFQVAVLNIIASLYAPLEQFLPTLLLHMRPSSASGALCASLALFLLENGRTERLRLTGQLLGAITGVIAIVAVWLGTSNPDLPASGPYLGPFSLAPVAFLLLGFVILALQSKNSMLSHITDALTSVLAFIVLVLFSEFFYGLLQIPGSSVIGPIRIPTLACLTLLTLTAVLRRAEYGVFSFFLSGGIDGHFARILAPILLAFPIIREISRARLLDSHLVPARYATAILSSSATLIAFILLFAFRD